MNSRWLWLLGGVVIAWTAAGCGDDATGGPSAGGPDATSPSDADSLDAGADASDAATACIPDDRPCGPRPDPCVGDCLGRGCCGKLCASGICSSPNMTFGPTCPSPCGGDPSGTWRLVGGCSSTCGTGGTGAVSATAPLTISADGGSTVTAIGYDTHCGGYINTGGSRSLGGAWSADAGTVDKQPYCVTGNDLWIFPTFTFGGTGTIALHFTR